MKKKCIRFLPLLLACLLLCGCFLEPAEGLYAVPKQSEEYYDLQNAEEKPNQKEQIRIKTESLRKYFPRNYSAQQMEREIIKLLEARYRAKDRGER